MSITPTDFAAGKRLLSTAEVAALLGVKIKALEKMRCRGDGPAYILVGRLPRYCESDVLAYAKRRTKRSTSDDIEDLDDSFGENRHEGDDR